MNIYQIYQSMHLEVVGNAHKMVSQRSNVARAQVRPLAILPEAQIDLAFIYYNPLF